MELHYRDLIQKLRRERRMSQTELAAAAGMSRTRVSEVETGRITPPGLTPQELDELKRVLAASDEERLLLDRAAQAGSILFAGRGTDEAQTLDPGSTDAADRQLLGAHV